MKNIAILFPFAAALCMGQQTSWTTITPPAQATITGGPWTIDQAVDFFVNEGYQSRSIGLVETKRGTSDATYLYYTLGKLQIMKLREDMKQKQGAAFNLQDFHNNLMKQGFAPIKVVRKAMLHDNSPVL